MLKGIKLVVRRALVKLKLYPHIKSSNLYEVYIRLFYKKYWNNFERKVKRLKKLINNDNKQVIIFDIGSNGGKKNENIQKVSR